MTDELRELARMRDIICQSYYNQGKREGRLEALDRVIELLTRTDVRRECDCGCEFISEFALEDKIKELKKNGTKRIK